MSDRSGPEVKVIRAGDIRRCPKQSLLPGHYRQDGTCRCDEREQAQRDVEQAQRGVEQAQQALADARERHRRT